MRSAPANTPVTRSSAAPAGHTPSLRSPRCNSAHRTPSSPACDQSDTPMRVRTSPATPVSQSPPVPTATVPTDPACTSALTVLHRGEMSVYFIHHFTWSFSTVSTAELSGPPDRRQICVCKFGDWLVGPLQRFVRRHAANTTHNIARHRYHRVG